MPGLDIDNIPFSMKSIELIKFISGEQVIAHILYDEEYAYLYKAYMMVPTGTGQLAFMPFMAGAKKEAKIKVKIDNILATVREKDIETELVSEYKNLTSDIITPSSPSLTEPPTGMKLL